MVVITLRRKGYIEKQNKGFPNILFFFFKQKTAYEISECDWSSDVCSSDQIGRASCRGDRKSTRLNSSHIQKSSYAVFCLKKKTPRPRRPPSERRSRTKVARRDAGRDFVFFF